MIKTIFKNLSKNDDLFSADLVNSIRTKASEFDITHFQGIPQYGMEVREVSFGEEYVRRTQASPIEYERRKRTDKYAECMIYPLGIK